MQEDHRLVGHFLCGSEGGQIVPTLFSSQIIMLWSSFLKMAILHTFEVSLQEENDLNPFTRVLCKVFSPSILNHKLLKSAKIFLVQVLGSIEDE